MTETIKEAIKGGMFRDLPNNLLFELSKVEHKFINGYKTGDNFVPTTFPVEVTEAYRKLAISYGHPYTNVSSFRWQTLPTAIKYAEMMEKAAAKAKEESFKIIKEYNDYKSYYMKHRQFGGSITADLRKLTQLAAEIKHLRKLKKKNLKDLAKVRQGTIKKNINNKQLHYENFIKSLQDKLDRLT